MTRLAQTGHHAKAKVRLAGVAARHKGRSKFLGGRWGSQTLRLRTGPLLRVLLLLFEARLAHHHHTVVAGRGELGRVRGHAVGGCGMGVEEGHEDRLLHQFVGQLDGNVEKLRVRRGVDGGLPEDVVAHVAGHVDLTRGAGENVCRQESLPQHAKVLAFGTIDVGGRVFAQLVGDCFKGFAVPLGLQGEFKSFEAVVLRKVGHECAESVRGRCGVGEDLFQ